MRLLLAYSSEPHYMSPPRLAEEQIDCGPYFHDRRREGRWQSLGTPRGDYDLAKVAERLGPDQQPDLVAVHVDGASMAGTPRNLAAFKCPKILLVADTHHGGNPLGNMIRYALDQPFDRVVLLYDRHHADFFHAAGIKNLHWLPSLTFAHSDARIRAAAATRREPRIAIVGTTSYHPRRLRLFSALVRRGLPLDWREIHQSESIAHYAGSTVGLNASMNGDLNMRVFEILAGGALLLTDRLAPASGLQDLLREDRDYVGYSTTEELVEKAAHLIAHPAEAAAIADSGARWFREHFTEQHRRSAFADLAFDGRERPEFALPKKSVAFPPGLPLETAIAGYHWLQVRHQRNETARVACAEGVPDVLARLFSTLPRVELLAANDDAPADLWVGATHQPTPLAARATHVWFWNAAPAAHAGLAARFAAQRYRQLAPGASLFGPPPAETADPLVGKARAHLQNGDLVGAMSAAGAALQANPRSVEALCIIAELAIEARNWDTASTTLAKAEALDPRSTLVPLLRRQVALQSPPRQARRFLAVARLAFDWRDHVRTRTFAELALASDEDCADAHHLLGLLDFYHAGEADSPATRESGLARLSRAAELQPARADYWLELAHARRLLGRHHDAAEAFRHALEREPSADTFLAHGRGLLLLGDAPVAAAAFRAGLARAPDHAALRDALRQAEAASASPAEGFSAPAANGPVTLPHELDSVASLLRSANAAPEELASSIATVFADRARAGRPCLPAARRVLLAHQPWFDVETPRLLTASLARGIFVALIDEATQAAPHALFLSTENLRSVEHYGVRLWDACRYRLALELRRPELDLDLANAADRAAIESFFTHARALIEKAVRFLDCYQPDTVVFAQGHDTLSLVLRQLAVRRGLRVVALENTFRRDRLLWDDVSGVTVNRSLAKNHYWRHRELITDGEAETSVAAYLSRLRELKAAEHAAPAAAPLCEGDAAPALLYLGQVGTDSSVLFGLRRFGSQARLIAALAGYAAGRGLRLVVKLHPKENPAFQDAHPWVRGLTLEALERSPEFVAARAQLGERLVLDSDNRLDTYNLIRSARACVTINSQAGLEALVLGRELVLCGDAFYGGLGFTHEADDEATLRFRLDRVLDEDLRLNHGPDARAFFHIYSEFYCLPKTPEALLALFEGRPRPALQPEENHAGDTAEAAA